MGCEGSIASLTTPFYMMSLGVNMTPGIYLLFANERGQVILR